MRSEVKYRLALLVILALTIPRLAWADFIWPPDFYVYSYTVWWVVVIGLAVEFVVYKWGFGQSWWRTGLLTVGVNLASAAAGGAFSWGSLLVLKVPGEAGKSVALSFLLASPVLLYAVTTAIEYLAAVMVFRVTRGWRSLGIVAAANVLSVALAVYAALELAARALDGGA